MFFWPVSFYSAGFNAGIAPFPGRGIDRGARLVSNPRYRRNMIRNAGFTERLLGAGGVVWFYLFKALLPLNLIFVYPQWSIQVRQSAVVAAACLPALSLRLCSGGIEMVGVRPLFVRLGIFLR